MGRRIRANSQTYSVSICSEAYLDIQAAIRFIAYENTQPVNAVKVFYAIHKAINQVALNPLAYKECEDIPTITKIYRRANCLSWAIVYRVVKDKVTILGVIHHASKASRFKVLRKRK